MTTHLAGLLRFCLAVSTWMFWSWRAARWEGREQQEEKIVESEDEKCFASQSDGIFRHRFCWRRHIVYRNELL